MKKFFVILFSFLLLFLGTTYSQNTTHKQTPKDREKYSKHVQKDKEKGWLGFFKKRHNIHKKGLFGGHAGKATAEKKL